MPSESALREFVHELNADSIDDDADLLERIDGGKRNARDLALAYLALGEIDVARRFARVAAPKFHQGAQFHIDEITGSDEPSALLTLTPWNHAMTAVMLATFAGDLETRRNVATDGVEWAELEVLDDEPIRETGLMIDVVAGFSAFLLEQPFAPYIDRLRTNYDALEDREIYDDRALHLATALEAIGDRDSDRVATACAGLDEVHAAIEIHDSVAAEAVNIFAAFCVAFAREHGLAVEYTSEYVPETVSTAYPLPE